MSKLNELAGSTLRDALDASSRNRRYQSQRRIEDHLQSQLERQEASAQRAAEISAKAAQMRAWLNQAHQTRAKVAEMDASDRALAHAALQAEIGDRLEQYTLERSVGGVERAVQRGALRLRQAEETHELLKAAHQEREAVRADLLAFRAQLHRATSGVERLDIPVAATQTKTGTRATAVAVRHVPAHLVKTPAAKASSFLVGAMQSPDPMTAIARRRENMIIKMIAANPGMAGQHLEKSLYMDKLDLQVMLKRLVSNGVLRQEGDAFWLLPRVSS